MDYTKIGWVNDRAPAINQTNLNHMDQGIYDAYRKLSEYEDIFTGDVDESVQNWLDDHPEATTTVQDNSLTTAKYRDGSVTGEKISDDSITDDKLYLSINDLNQFEKVKDYTITNGSYIEAIAYGEGFIYAGARNHNDNDSTTIYAINEETLNIVSEFTIPVGIVNALEYYDGYLYATMVTDASAIYKISVSDHSYTVFKTFLPDSELYLNYDVATGKFIISQHDYTNGTKTLMLKIYNSLSDVNPEREVNVPLEYWDRGENIQQDRCVYNNLMYEANWYGLTVIDIAEGIVVKRFGTENDVEPEGICRNGDKCYMALHNIGQNWHEFLFKLNKYSDSRNGLGSMCKKQSYHLTDVNFGYVRGEGVYPFSFSNQTTARDCGMPQLLGSLTYPTEGVLMVETSSKDTISLEPEYILQTIYDTVNDREFFRYSNDGGSSFSSWKESLTDYCKPIVASSVESTYFNTTHTIMVRRVGVFLIIQGFFNGTNVLPSTRVSLGVLPAGTVLRTLIVPAVLMDGGTYNGTKITCYVLFNAGDQNIYLYPQGVEGKSGLLHFSAVLF